MYIRPPFKILTSNEYRFKASKFIILYDEHHSYTFNRCLIKVGTTINTNNIQYFLILHQN